MIIKNLLYKYIFDIDLTNEKTNNNNNDNNDFFIKYQDYKLKKMSIRLIFILLSLSSIVTIYAITGLILRLKLNLDSSVKKGAMLGLIIFNAFEVVIMVPTFIYVYNYCDLTNIKMIKLHAYIQDIWLNQLVLRIGITLCLSVWIGDCTNDDHHYFCNNLQPCHGLPNSIGMQLFLFPMILPLMFSCIQFYAAVTAWIIAVLSFIISGSILGWTQELISASLLTSIPTIVVIFELERQQLKLFKTAKTLDENQRHAKEAHAKEMRYMISNVAHDLKTVSK